MALLLLQAAMTPPVQQPAAQGRSVLPIPHLRCLPAPPLARSMGNLLAFEFCYGWTGSAPGWIIRHEAVAAFRQGAPPPPGSGGRSSLEATNCLLFYLLKVPHP